jgi:hypothetical protein
MSANKYGSAERVHNIKGFPEPTINEQTTNERFVKESSTPDVPIASNTKNRDTEEASPQSIQSLITSSNLPEEENMVAVDNIEAGMIPFA